MNWFTHVASADPSFHCRCPRCVADRPLPEMSPSDDILKMKNGSIVRFTRCDSISDPWVSATTAQTCPTHYGVTFPNYELCPQCPPMVECPATHPSNAKTPCPLCKGTRWVEEIV